LLAAAVFVLGCVDGEEEAFLIKMHLFEVTIAIVSEEFKKSRSLFVQPKYM
jgi:hypothetical protein